MDCTRRIIFNPSPEAQEGIRRYHSRQEQNVRRLSRKQSVPRARLRHTAVIEGSTEEVPSADGTIEMLGSFLGLLESCLLYNCRFDKNLESKICSWVIVLNYCSLHFKYFFGCSIELHQELTEIISPSV